MPGEDGKIAHAQLIFGNGMIMLGGGNHEGEYGQVIQSPDDAGGKVTGILTKYENTWYVIIQTREVFVTGYCVYDGPGAPPAPAPVAEAAP